MRYTIVLLMMIAMAGCNSGCNGVQLQKTAVNITFTNASTNDLDWVRLKWDGPYAAAGILLQGNSKGVIDLQWPYLSAATLTFIDDKTRQRYNIEISFAEANQKIHLGKCHLVTIRILSYDKVEVICE